VYKNGALTRDHIREKYADGSWPKFSETLASTAAGNQSKIGFYFLNTELYPAIQGLFYFNERDEACNDWADGKCHIRAVVESQFAAMYLHSKRLGLVNHKRVLVTGGGSKNKEMMQVLSDMFHVPVYTLGDLSKSACLGAAYKALHGWVCHSQNKFVDFASVVGPLGNITLVAEPKVDPSVYQVYFQRYTSLEQNIIKNAQQ